MLARESQNSVKNTIKLSCTAGANTAQQDCVLGSVGANNTGYDLM